MILIDGFHKFNNVLFLNCQIFKNKTQISKNNIVGNFLYVLIFQLHSFKIQLSRGHLQCHLNLKLAHNNLNDHEKFIGSEEVNCFLNVNVLHGQYKCFPFLCGPINGATVMCCVVSMNNLMWRSDNYCKR